MSVEWELREHAEGIDGALELVIVEASTGRTVADASGGYWFTSEEMGLLVEAWNAKRHDGERALGSRATVTPGTVLAGDRGPAPHWRPGRFECVGALAGSDWQECSEADARAIIDVHWSDPDRIVEDLRRGMVITMPPQSFRFVEDGAVAGMIERRCSWCSWVAVSSLSPVVAALALCSHQATTHPHRHVTSLLWWWWAQRPVARMRRGGAMGILSRMRWKRFRSGD